MSQATMDGRALSDTTISTAPLVADNASRLLYLDALRGLGLVGCAQYDEK